VKRVRAELTISVFLASPLRRQVIVKEKLVFPSGSKFKPSDMTFQAQELTKPAATAQLIALLHEIPPPSQPTSEPVRGSAYRRLPRSGEAGRLSEDSNSPGYSSLPIAKADQSEVMGGDGWRALGWSFVSSGTMTVCHHTTRGRPSAYLTVAELCISGGLCHSGL
jgi:hypothetical protein